MSKKKSKFSNSVERLKGKFSGLFKKSSKAEDGEEFYDDEDFSENYEEEYADDDEDIEAELQDFDDDFSEETDPSFQQLTVTDIKKQQIENGESPPDLPPMDLDEDEDDYSVEDEDNYPSTNPSLREFDLPPIKKSFKQKMQEALANVKASLSHRKSSHFSMRGLGSGPLAKFGDINFDEFFNKIFSPQSRPAAHRAYLAVFFILGSYLTGRMISGFLTPAPSGKVPTARQALSLNKADILRKKLATMRTNDLFQAPEEVATPIIGKRPKKDDFKEEKVCLASDKKSSLGIKLVNTVILQDSVKSLASVQMRGKEDYLREGDSIPNMIEVGKIDRKKLIFKNLKNRQCEFIENTEKDNAPKKPLKIVREPKKAKEIIEQTKISGITQVGNNFKIKKEVRERMLGNISEVLTQARAVQIKNPDGSLSFRMQEIVPGSIYSQLNIQEGDMITGINGKKITNMAELMNLFGQIDKVDHFELSLSREGVEQNLEYDFE